MLLRNIYFKSYAQRGENVSFESDLFTFFGGGASGDQDERSDIYCFLTYMS